MAPDWEEGVAGGLPQGREVVSWNLALTQQSLGRGVSDRGSSVCGGGGKAPRREKGGESPGGGKGLVQGVLKEPNSRECLGAPRREPCGLRTSRPLGDLPTTLGSCVLAAKAFRISKIQSRT